MVLSDATNVEGQAYQGRKRAYMYDASREMPSFPLFSRCFHLFLSRLGRLDPVSLLLANIEGRGGFGLRAALLGFRGVEKRDEIPLLMRLVLCWCWCWWCRPSRGVSDVCQTAALTSHVPHPACPDSALVVPAPSPKSWKPGNQRSETDLVCPSVAVVTASGGIGICRIRADHRRRL